MRRCLPAERLAQLRQDIGGRIVFTTSFGLEDQVITHLLWEQDIDVELITLDTGRLFNETYALWAATEQRYGRRIRALYPSRRNLEALIASQGINGFYEFEAGAARLLPGAQGRTAGACARPVRRHGSPDCAPSSPRSGKTWRW